MDIKQLRKYIEGRSLEIVLELEVTTTEARKKRLSEEFSALKELNEILDLRFPVKPRSRYGGSVYQGVCPRCFCTEDSSAAYCRACGQALDWENGRFSKEDE